MFLIESNLELSMALIEMLVTIKRYENSDF